MQAPIVDQRAEATKYMSKHKVLKLFEILGSQLAKNKPEDPNEFLLAELKRINDLKLQKQPVTLFNENDIGIMFSVFDLTNRGYVDHTQYLKALNAVGVDKPTLAVPLDPHIDKKTFISHIYAEVLKDSY